MNNFFVKTLFCKAAAMLLFTSLPLHASFTSLDKIVVIVDDDVITQGDVNNKLQQVELNIKRQGRPLPPTSEIEKEVMDRLILESLQMQLARRAGVHIPEEQLTDAVNNIAKRNNLTLAQFRQKITEDGMSYPQMREQIRRDLTMQQVQQGHLRSRIQISDKEIEDFLSSADGKNITIRRYQVSHILLPLTEDASATAVKKANNDLADLRSEFNAKLLNFDTFINGQTYRQNNISGGDLGWRTADDLPSLFADTVADMQSGEISQPIRSGAGWHLVKLGGISGDDKIVHQTHSRHILIKLSEVRNEKQATDLAESLYERIQTGEDFSLLAKEYSDDPGSALQGGDLGWSMPGQFTPAFEKTLGFLQDQEVSKPFKSDFGWHILQKLGERDHNMTRDSQKNKAYQTLYERRFNDELDGWLLKIRDEAFIEYK